MSTAPDQTTVRAGSPPPARTAGLPAAASAAGSTRLARCVRRARRCRLLRHLRRNAEWVANARCAPIVQVWMDSHRR